MKIDYIKYLFDLQKTGIKLGLSNINNLMAYYNINYNKLKIIHIGGTNGKGSTSNIINSIYRASGYKVGLFTSPHLVSFNERIKIDNIEINDIELKEQVEFFKEGFEKFNITFFEATTAIGLKYFLDNNVDIVILEVGMGGRYDSTNIVTPQISAITGIGLDHTTFLGNSLLQIAKEKAGIIKTKIPVVLNENKKFVIKKIKSIASKNSSNFYLANKEFRFVIKKNRHEKSKKMSFNWFGKELDNISFDINGSYQLYNLKTALTVIKILKRKKIFTKVDENSIRDGLNKLIIPGRMEIISSNPNILIDAAHNFQGITKVFADVSLLKDSYNKIHLITGYLKDKDFQKYSKLAIETFIELGSISFVQSSIERSLDINKVKNFISEKSKNSIKLKNAIASNKISFSNSVKKGFNITLNNYQSGDLIFITGSHFILGDFLEFYSNREIFKRLKALH